MVYRSLQAHIAFILRQGSVGEIKEGRANCPVCLRRVVNCKEGPHVRIIGGVLIGLGAGIIDFRNVPGACRLRSWRNAWNVNWGANIIVSGAEK